MGCGGGRIGRSGWQRYATVRMIISVIQGTISVIQGTFAICWPKPTPPHMSFCCIITIQLHWMAPYNFIIIHHLLLLC
jgi:hypothetical protein